MRLTKQILAIISYALQEDVGIGDVTTNAFLVNNPRKTASIIARQRGVFCGAEMIRAIYKIVDRTVKVQMFVHDGQLIKKNEIVCRVTGPLKSILKAERVVLNYLGRLSGISTQTRSYVAHVKTTNALICDTRKTMPGFRFLEKYAVLKGGGHNHRMGLFDQVLIKDNHYKGLPKSERDNTGKYICYIRKRIPKGMKIQVEVESITQLKKVLPAHPDIILLDNMSINSMKQAIQMVRTENNKSNTMIETEASGNVTLNNVLRVAKTGVDRISIGALTHSVPNFDFSLEVDE